MNFIWTYRKSSIFSMKFIGSYCISSEFIPNSKLQLPKIDPNIDKLSNNHVYSHLSLFKLSTTIKTWNYIWNHYFLGNLNAWSLKPEFLDWRMLNTKYLASALVGSSRNQSELVGLGRDGVRQYERWRLKREWEGKRWKWGLFWIEGYFCSKLDQK